MCKKVITILVFCILFNHNTQARETVWVGGIDNPPLVMRDEGVYFGLALDVLKAMNQIQNEYGFEFKPSRYPLQSLRAGEFELFITDTFHHDWTTRLHNLEATRPFLNDAQRFITKLTPDYSPKIFEQVGNHQMAILFNHHYAFTSGNTNPHYLKQHFSVKLFNAESRLLTFVKKNPGTIGVVSDSFWLMYQRLHPSISRKLQTSKQADSSYVHYFMVKKNNHPSRDQINDLLGQLQRRGVLLKLWRKHGVAPLAWHN